MSRVTDKPIMDLVNRVHREFGDADSHHVQELYLEAVDAEAGWKNCSAACARLQGRIDNLAEACSKAGARINELESKLGEYEQRAELHMQRCAADLETIARQQRERDDALSRLDTAEKDAFAFSAEIERLEAQHSQGLAEYEKLEHRLGAAQSRIDALMLEYCPDEMTPEQLAEWGKHQRSVEDSLPAGGTANTGSVAGPITVRRTSDPAAGPDGAVRESPQQVGMCHVHELPCDDNGDCIQCRVVERGSTVDPASQLFRCPKCSEPMICGPAKWEYACQCKLSE